MSRKELVRRIKDGLVTVLDVRPEDEFALGHLPGAINIPLKTLTRQLKKLDRVARDRRLLPRAYCVLSFEAVAALRARGFKARRLEDGFPEWRAAGLPVERDRSGRANDQVALTNGARRRNALFSETWSANGCRDSLTGLSSPVNP